MSTFSHGLSPYRRTWCLVVTMALIVVGGMVHNTSMGASSTMKAVAAMVKACQTNDGGAYHNAAKYFRSAPSSVVTEVLALLDSGDAATRCCSIEALKEMNLHAHSATGRVVKIFLDDPDEVVRLAALEAIPRIGWPIAVQIIPKMLRVFDARSDEEKQRILVAIGHFGQHSEAYVPQVIKIARDPRHRARITAVRSLSYIVVQMPPGRRHADEGVAALIDLLRDDDVRLFAADALSLVGSQHQIDLIPIIQILKTSHDEPSLLSCLGVLQNQSRIARIDTAIPAVIDLGRDSSRPADRIRRSHVVVTVARTLGVIGAKNDESIAFLLASLGEDGSLLDEAAVEALGMCGTAAKDAVPRLILRARRPFEGNTLLQRKAMVAIGRIAPSDPRVVDVLLKGTQHPSPDIREEAIAVIAEQQLISGPIRKAALHLLADESAAVRALAARVCVHNGEIGANVVSTIRELAMREPTSDVASRHAIAAARLGIGQSGACLSVLRNVIEEGPSGNRYFAVSALGDWSGKLDSDSTKAIARCLEDLDGLLQIEAASALLKHNSMESRAIDTLVHRAMRDSDPVPALKVLANTRHLPASVIAQLKVFEGAPDWQVGKLFGKIASHR